MFNVDVTRLSSRGQVVIPQDMRKGFGVGDKFVIIRSDQQLILKPVGELGANFIKDMEFARETLAAIGRYEKGRFKEMDGERFLKELERW